MPLPRMRGLAPTDYILISFSPRLNPSIGLDPEKGKKPPREMKGNRMLTKQATVVVDQLGRYR